MTRNYMKAKPKMISKVQARVNEARLTARVAIASKLIADCQASLGYKLSRGQCRDLLKDNHNDWSDADCDKIEATINGETKMAKTTPHQITLIAFSTNEDGSFSVYDIVETSFRNASFFARRFYRNSEITGISAISPGKPYLQPIRSIRNGETNGNPDSQ